MSPQRRRVCAAVLAGMVCAALDAAAGHSQVSVAGAWARPTAPGQQVGGGYLTLRSSSADRLLGASTPRAARVEFHAMAMQGDVMVMRQLDAIDLPTGQAVALAPGLRHLMLVGLKGALEVGDKLPLTLRFEHAGEVRVEMTVAGRAPPASEPRR